MTFRGGSSLNVGVYDLAGLPAVMPIPDLVAALKPPARSHMSYPICRRPARRRADGGSSRHALEVAHGGARCAPRTWPSAWPSLGREPFDCYGHRDRRTGTDCERHNGDPHLRGPGISRSGGRGWTAPRVLGAGAGPTLTRSSRYPDGGHHLATHSYNPLECRRRLLLDGDNTSSNPPARGGEVAIAPPSSSIPLSGIAGSRTRSSAERSAPGIGGRNRETLAGGGQRPEDGAEQSGGRPPDEVRRVDTIDREPGRAARSS